MQQHVFSVPFFLGATSMVTISLGVVVESKSSTQAASFTTVNQQRQQLYCLHDMTKYQYSHNL